MAAKVSNVFLTKTAIFQAITVCAMKTFLCLLFALSNVCAFGQSNSKKDSTDLLLIAIGKEIMLSARYCALITIDAEGQPRARTMDPLPPNREMVVWLGTNPNSRKVWQIKENPGVTLYYAAPDATGYVSLGGTAYLVDDPAEKAIRWKAEWEPFYANRAKDLLLIKVVPQWLEVISYSHGISGDSISWQPPRVLIHGKD